jgi:ribonuclease HI
VKPITELLKKGSKYL